VVIIPRVTNLNKEGYAYNYLTMHYSVLTTQIGSDMMHHIRLYL